MISPQASVDKNMRSSPLRRIALADSESQHERIFGLVYRQMATLAGHSSDLEDLIQTAAEQALRSLGRFDGRSELSTWTYRICHNVYLKQRRWVWRWWQRFMLLEDPAQFDPPDPRLSHGHTLEQRERIARLWAALGRVSAKRRVVVVLHDLEGLEIESIAEIVGCNPLTVRSRLRDGRKILAQVLEADPYFGLSACKEKSP